MEAVKSGFSILSFSFDGEPVGPRFQEFEDLSGKWLDICDQFLKHNGPVFDTSWGKQLARFETKMTSASGSALLTFRVSGQIAASGMLLTGGSPAAEAQVTQMFIESLMRIKLVQNAAKNRPNPFGEIVQTTTRPLLVVIPWPQEPISDEDHGVVVDLSLHLAGAWFRSEEHARSAPHDPRPLAT